MRKPEKQIRIFYKPHQDQRCEGDFAAFLASHLGGSLLNEWFRFDPVVLNHLVSTQRLIACLNASDCRLSKIKHQQCIEQLKTLPAWIRVAMKPSRISFDLVVEQNGLLYYWEFHERQHRTLTVSRSEPVYGLNGEEFSVPRYLPRLIRDVWRMQVFPNLTIVCYDWFEHNRGSYNPVIAPGFREYCPSDQFSFSEFCTPYRKPSTKRTPYE